LEACKEYPEKGGLYHRKVDQYNKEKGEIEQEARMLEKGRNEAKAHGQGFGIAIIFLQIAIFLSSIAALMKKKLLGCLRLLVGFCGLVCFANDLWLFMN
jgi:hypothetical protein